MGCDPQLDRNISKTHTADCRTLLGTIIGTYLFHETISHSVFYEFLTRYVLIYHKSKFSRIYYLIINASLQFL